MSRKLILTLILSLIIAASAFIQSCSDTSEEKSISSSDSTSYVGDAACKNCHAGEYEKWKRSHHFLAMLHASDTTVLGDFSGVKLTADGITSTFFKRDNRFFVNTEGPEGQYSDYEVKYTFGVAPLQQYLVEFPGGKLQTLRQSWDSDQKKWFHQYPGQKIAGHDWLHWSNGAQRWNTMCADCHSTNVKKGYSFDADTFNTTWSDINVSCESCHGPGKRHIELASEAGYASRKQGSGLTFPSTDTSHFAQIETCAPCHSRRSVISPAYLHTGNFLDNYLPEIVRNTFYHADGQINEEDYEYGSFTQSKMFHQGVRCTNCHDPHTMEFKFEGNKLCTQCHASTYDSPEHHFHKESTESSQCVSCHMPSKRYMVNDLRRDHSFRIPRPDQSVQYGTPNACNSCHSKKDAKWAAAAIEKWYGTKRAYHFSDDLIPGSLGENTSVRHLEMLLSRDSIPAIVRATALYYLGNTGDPKQAELIRKNLRDSSPLVRSHALKAFTNWDPAFWQSDAEALLDDKIRAVRISAAELLSAVPYQNISESRKSAFNNARREFEIYLDHQLDFPQGRAAKGLDQQQRKDFKNAAYYYESAIKADSLVTGVRTNLSIVYSSLNENQNAERVLLDALKIDPNDGSAAYNLGLLYYELGNTDAAKKYMEQSARLLPNNPRVFYNYGLLLQSEGRMNDAEKIFLKGLERAPSDARLNYVTAVLYLNSGKLNKARPYAEMLVVIDPQNQDYRELLKQTGKK